VRTPLLLCPLENENSDLLIMYLLGRGRWDGSHLLTVLTISHPTVVRTSPVLVAVHGDEEARRTLNATFERRLPLFQNRATATDVLR